jgi:hypothetical protein
MARSSHLVFPVVFNWLRDKYRALLEAVLKTIGTVLPASKGTNLLIETVLVAVVQDTRQK